MHIAAQRTRFTYILSRRKQENEQTKKIVEGRSDGGYQGFPPISSSSEVPTFIQLLYSLIFLFYFSTNSFTINNNLLKLADAIFAIFYNGLKNFLEKNKVRVFYLIP